MSKRHVTRGKSARGYGRIIAEAIESNTPGLIVNVFKERPEALMQLYTEYFNARHERKGEVRTLNFLNTNPIIAFQILEHAFPDVINRLWWAVRKPDATDDSEAIQVVIRHLKAPYEIDHSFIDPILLQRCADDEQVARQVAHLHRFIDPRGLPHAQYCFLSDIRISRAMRKFVLMGNEDNGWMLRFPRDGGSYGMAIYRYISVDDADRVRELIFDESDSLNETRIDGEGPSLYAKPSKVFSFANPDATLWRPSSPYEWVGGQFADNEPISVPLYIAGAAVEEPLAQLRALAADNDGVYVMPGWKPASFEWLLAKLDEQLAVVPNESDVPSRAYYHERAALREEILETMRELKEDDPRLYEYLQRDAQKGKMDRLFNNFFIDKRIWWRVLFSKVALVELSGGADEIGEIYPREGDHRAPNPHRIYQCRHCRSQTHNVVAETGHFFCNGLCLQAYNVI